MHIRRGLGLALWCAMVATAAAGPRPTVDVPQIPDVAPMARVPVVVYLNASDLAAPDLWSALDVARGVLVTASIDVVWTLCGPGECLTPEPAALKMRMVQAPRVASRDPDRRLGEALIDRGAKRGVLASVFVDRTRRLAGDLRIDHRALLGHTMAHELGHLLLATTKHSKAGLMRKEWSREELMGSRRADWIFAPPDVAAIRAGLARAEV